MMTFEDEISNTKPARVLLVEDDAITRQLVSMKLEHQCNLMAAADASEGITAYNSFQPDIVFMDIGLPDGDGHRLVNWIIKNDPGAFIVMFSGRYDTDNVIQSLDAGAKGFVSKPVDINKMLHFIRICPKPH